MRFKSQLLFRTVFLFVILSFMSRSWLNGQVSSEDELAILELIVPIQSKIELVAAEDKIATRKLWLKTMKSLFDYQTGLVKEGQVQMAVDVASFMKTFRARMIPGQIDWIDPVLPLNGHNPNAFHPDIHRQPIPPTGLTTPTTLPEAALAISKEHEDSLQRLQKEYQKKLGLIRKESRPEIKKLESKFQSQGKLESLLLLRRAQHQLDLSLDVQLVQPAPLVMSSANVQPGQVFVYSFDGVSLASNLYGTGVYTTDSNLAAAIIHSGALRLGERGLVKVTILPGLTQYTGSTQNGVTSSSYGAWRSSFKVERYHPIDEDDSKEDSAPPE